MSALTGWLSRMACERAGAGGRVREPADLHAPYCTLAGENVAMLSAFTPCPELSRCLSILKPFARCGVDVELVHGLGIAGHAHVECARSGAVA
jgi:hypothetical protein